MADNRFDEMRQEIIQLLRAQLEALADLSGLTDAQLAICYRRQERVRQLRDQLSAGTTLPDPATTPLSSTGEPAVASL